MFGVEPRFVTRDVVKPVTRLVDILMEKVHSTEELKISQVTGFVVQPLYVGALERIKNDEALCERLARKTMKLISTTIVQSEINSNSNFRNRIRFPIHGQLY